MTQQQSNSSTPGTPNTRGSQTREQDKAIFEQRENTKGADVPTNQKPISETTPASAQVGGEYEISTGDRSIQRGANQASEHHKNRSE
ncbi:hypothetical protein [Devosia sp. RR2S18]|uniref:hypothetical protein n=1 Tax=Devosia rhizosphaerae TaxID=3049774 RepID=UPI002541AEC3|nr:hypothetical protein [Devosia sp. RR2S18]WIJ23475.1 hypothetical protein QOV41_10305 [Devosia sp. RR2S18]